ncbi:MAG: hypothetical protein MH204_04040, partial [Fimbriimonadaceae bacterium]|nr:hypothetical protein [Fimbriimonadaceae bacterium]
SASGRSGALPWTLNQTRLTSRSLAGETQTDRTEVSTSYTQGRFFVTTGLAREGVLSRTTADSATLERQSLDTRGRYLAGRGWSAGFGASLSRLQTGGDSAAGRDLRLDIGYRPNDRFSSTLEYIDADPGSLTDLSRFQSGFGLGFNGNGFSGGVDGPFLTTTARVRRLALGGAWNPEESLSLFGRLSVSRNQGALSADTETTALSGGLDWGGWSWLRLNGTLAYSRSRSLSSPSLTETTALGFFASGTPAGRFSFTTGASILLSGGNTGFGQNSWQFDLGCLYRPLDRHSFGLNAGLGRSRGYLPQESQDIQAFYRYEVIRGLEVGLSHRWRDIANLDPTVTGGAFRSRGFDLEFNFTFGR